MTLREIAEELLKGYLSGAEREVVEVIARYPSDYKIPFNPNSDVVAFRKIAINHGYYIE